MPPAYRDEEDPGQPLIPPLTDDESDTESGPDLHVRAADDDDDDGHDLPTPVWLREQAASLTSRWIPLSLRKAGRAVVMWVKGPVPPRELHIDGIFPKIQQAPIRLLDLYVPKRRHRIVLLVVLYATWFLTWSLLVKHHATSGYIKGYGSPTNLWCGSSFWRDDNGCGLNGNDCRPFSLAHLAFRCPATCEQTHLLEDHVVGNQTLIYQGLVVGGPKADDPESLAIYRGDSFICQAAIHAGVISKVNGGCGVATLLGARSHFEATEAHGIKSTAFPATFPRAYTFQRLSESHNQCPTDSRWPTFVVTAVALVLLAVFTTDPAVFFFSTFVILFFHVVLVSDPPNRSNFYELVSTLFARLLPGCFIVYVLYITSARPLLTGLRAQLEKTILYLGFCFIGALNNYTFAPLIPIERFTPHDLAQPGAGVALAIIISSIIVIVISQIHWIRVSGNMPKYLAIYGAMVLSLLILLALPGQRLRIHHYILALLFMPGTAFQVRPSLVYQGLLLGLFINGAARWGYASIVQTPASLGFVDGGGGGSTWWGAIPPNVTATVGHGARNITFDWGSLPPDTGIDGISILENDVERFRLYNDEELFWDDSSITVPRRKPKDKAPEPSFFRFAFISGSEHGLYSKPAVWDEHGNWIPANNK
ncbi:hypothetical protein DV736_g2643, partial [Chaetothyriales sp. CBS 134916]